MDYKVSVFDTSKEYKAFLKSHQSIKTQFINNITKCFFVDAYESGSKQFKAMYTYDEFVKMTMKNYVLHLQSKKLKKTIMDNGGSYMCKVFFHKDNILLFSCSLEVSPKYVEIHDVCVAPQETGKGKCKEFISKVCDYIKHTFPTHKIKIVCDKVNTPACKCYARIFGTPKKETRTTYIYSM